MLYLHTIKKIITVALRLLTYTCMEKTMLLEKKIERLERIIQLQQEQIDDLDICYSMLLGVIEQGVESGKLRFNLSCFKN